MLNAYSEIVRIPLPTPFPVGPANVFLVKDEVPTLVDAGARVPQAFDRLCARLQENGMRIGDIGRVLLTHGHLDHTGLLAEIVDESGAEVYAHPFVVEQYRSYDEGVEDSMEFLAGAMRHFGVPDESIWRLMETRSTYRALADKVDIKYGLADCERVGKFVACHVPGHSAADILYYDPDRRIAFGGDHLLRNISPNPLIRKPRPGEKRPMSLVEYQQSLKRTYALEMDLCFPGHGEPFGNHRRVIDSLFERHERRTAEILAMLDGQALTPYDIMMRLFPKIDARILHLGLSVAVGHLEVLEERGLAKPEDRDGVIYYRPIESR